MAPVTQDTAKQRAAQGEEANQSNQVFQFPNAFCKHTGIEAHGCARRLQPKPRAVNIRSCLPQTVHIVELMLNCREAAGLRGLTPHEYEQGSIRKLEKFICAHKKISEKCSQLLSFSISALLSRCSPLPAHQIQIKILENSLSHLAFGKCFPL